MTMVNPYCTLSEYKAWNTIDTTNAGDDVVIEQIIESISRQIDGICGRFFYVTTATVKYYTAEESDILRTDDISSSTSFALETDDDGDGTYENTWAATDYSLWPYQPKNGRPFLGIERSANGSYNFPLIKHGVKVTALWGWAAVPADVKTACLIGVDAEYHARNGQNLSTDTTITAAGVVITPRGLPRSAMEKLAPYLPVVQ